MCGCSSFPSESSAVFGSRLPVLLRRHLQLELKDFLHWLEETAGFYSLRIIYLRKRSNTLKQQAANKNCFMATFVWQSPPWRLRGCRVEGRNGWTGVTSHLVKGTPCTSPVLPEGDLTPGLSSVLQSTWDGHKRQNTTNNSASLFQVQYQRLLGPEI